jgi:hypothetical protein
MSIKAEPANKKAQESVWLANRGSTNTAKELHQA